MVFGWISAVVLWQFMGDGGPEAEAFYMLFFVFCHGSGMGLLLFLPWALVYGVVVRPLLRLFFSRRG